MDVRIFWWEILKKGSGYYGNEERINGCIKERKKFDNKEVNNHVS